ncbi:gnat family protein [Diplodia corticola]|uniref:Gnat family protein n=1 Tax=Diplodia corticola TaxID=236234 RepID=A0A1J9REF1_9PEZI|nr:gnat family protein [Diplodia corticola]OJD39894.1 gnat family protein [Diplodia corticola]
MAPTLQLSRATEADIDAFLDPIYAAFEGNDIRTMFFGHDNPAHRASTKTRIAEWMREGNHNVWLKVEEKETGRIVGGSWWMVSPILWSFPEYIHLLSRSQEHTEKPKTISNPIPKERHAHTKTKTEARKKQTNHTTHPPTHRTSFANRSGQPPKQIYPHWTPNPALTPSAAAASVTLPFLSSSGPTDRAMGEALMSSFLARRARHMYGEPHVLLALLFTHPAHQRRGAGSLQMRWGAALADGLLVPLWVEATAAGRRLYERHGAGGVEEVRDEARAAGDVTGDAVVASDGRGVWVCEYTMMRREPGSRVVVAREGGGI